MNSITVMDFKDCAWSPRLPSAQTVYQHHGGCAFGDAWVVTQWLLRQSERTGMPALLSRRLPRDRDAGAASMLAMISDMASAMDSPGTIALSDEEGVPIPVPDYFGNPLPPYLLLKDYRWDGGRSGAVCMQLDGVSNATRKNPPIHEAVRLYQQWPVCIPIGRPLTWRQSASLLASCRFFVGVCSGMSHIAHSVGCPTIIIQYGDYDVTSWHPRAGWLLARGTDEAIAIGNAMIGLHDH